MITSKTLQLQLLSWATCFCATLTTYRRSGSQGVTNSEMQNFRERKSTHWPSAQPLSGRDLLLWR